jgi:glycosyltransferase involved in cell wall biosynthesis
MSDTLRIAQILGTPEGRQGGLERHTLDLCGELAKRHEVHLIADPGFLPQKPEGVHFHPIDFRQSRWNPFLYLQISRYIREIQPDLVHAQAGKAAMIWSNLRWRFPHIPCLGTQHLDHNIKPYRRLDHMITVSSFLASRHPAGRATVVHNGLSLPEMLSDEERRRLHDELLGAHEGPLLITVGRLDAQKGYDILLQAMPGIPGHLVIVGEGHDRPLLESLIQTLGLADKVTLLGWRRDIPRLLQAADLCIISSRSEGFPLVMIEALHAGAPIVSTNVSGVMEIIPPDLLVPVEDVAALHGKLAATVPQAAALRERFQPIFQHARTELTLTGMARNTETVYRKLLSRSPSAQG